MVRLDTRLSKLQSNIQNILQKGRKFFVTRGGLSMIKVTTEKFSIEADTVNDVREIMGMLAE